jgi:hypothetical protein
MISLITIVVFIRGKSKEHGLLPGESLQRRKKDSLNASASVWSLFALKLYSKIFDIA